MKELKSVHIEAGICPLCGKPIPEEWAGKDPTPGTICKDCWSLKDKLYNLENVNLIVNLQVNFDPIFDTHEYHFDFKGTEVAVNDRIGRVVSTQADGAYADFGDTYENGYAKYEFVKGLGYWRLRKLYEEMGGSLVPPKLNLPTHQPMQAKLRKKPILPIEISYRDGRISCISVGQGGLPYSREVPYLHSLHAVCNLFVRWRYGFMPNYACEGGFIGRDFEIRNHMMAKFPGISVRGNIKEELTRIQSVKELKHTLCMVALQELSLDKEEMRVFEETGLHINDIGLESALGAWIKVMETLLRYNWHKEQDNTIESRWRNFGIVQDLLLNLIGPIQLENFLKFMRNGKMNHCGNAF